MLPLLYPLGEYLNALRSTRKLGAKQMLPSHGAVIEDPETRIQELLQHHDRRLQSCVAALGSSPSTAYAVSLQLFGSALDHFGRWMALGETLSHLEHLVNHGLVTKVDEGECVCYARA